MEKKENIVGIDVSKSTLDVFIHSINYSFVVSNDPKGFAVLIETTCKLAKCKAKDLFFCFENTGKYSRQLSVFLRTQNILFKMESALAIKKSMGITRGKNDKIDAIRIANYAFEKMHQLNPTKLPGEKIEIMKMLLSLREKLIKQRTALKNGLTDLHDCYNEGETTLIKEIQERLIENLDKEIELIESKVEGIIKKDKSMYLNFQLILSIRGIGKINAFYFIAYTANFTAFNSARAFACYCGIAPFANSSGTIIGRTKVHHYANKQLKSLINMAATSAINIKGEFQNYYNKRVNEQGKNKMSTINIIRNKLVHRVFAVVKRGTPYVDLLKFAA